MSIKLRDANKILIDNGFVLDRIRGSHYQYVRNEQKVVINIRTNEMVWRRLCKENKIIF